MRIATHTLGCKLNFAETSHLVRRFIEDGHSVVEFHEIADLYIINTCTVTSVAEKKCRNAIRQAVATNPIATVAVMGCFAQNAAEEIAKIPGVSIILGNNNKNKLFDIITKGDLSNMDGNIFTEVPDPKDFQLSYSSGDRTRTFFKIQDGCDYFCTYCAIPFARGRSRNATIEETLCMAHRIADSGAKEVVLTGVNTGTFGHNTLPKQENAPKESFIDLLKELDNIEGIERYRISSIEPNLLTDEIVDFVAHSKHFAHHFHIPLQAGNDYVLKKMQRRYDTAFYAEKINHIKEVMPDACIAADLMVGFYGEGQKEFDDACRFIESLPLSYLHVFTYSERPNTAALRMNEKVPMDERRRRSSIMHQISEQKKRRYYEANIGTQSKVLWESDVKEGKMFGFTDNYIRVKRNFQPELINTLQSVTLQKLNFDEDLFEI